MEESETPPLILDNTKAGAVKDDLPPGTRLLHLSHQITTVGALCNVAAHHDVLLSHRQCILSWLTVDYFGSHLVADEYLKHD